LNPFPVLQTGAIRKNGRKGAFKNVAEGAAAILRVSPGTILGCSGENSTPKSSVFFSGIFFHFTYRLKFDELIIVLPLWRLYSRHGNNQAPGRAFSWKSTLDSTGESRSQRCKPLRETVYMTPYELSKTLHKDLSPLAPRLSAALNRALTQIGEGSVLFGLGPGTHENEAISFQETEVIALRQEEEPAAIILKISQALALLEAHSRWKVMLDKKPSRRKDRLELLYTIFRRKDPF
jgi:hypothetical protein